MVPAGAGQRSTLGGSLCRIPWGTAARGPVAPDGVPWDPTGGVPRDPAGRGPAALGGTALGGSALGGPADAMAVVTPPTRAAACQSRR